MTSIGEYSHTSTHGLLNPYLDLCLLDLYKVKLVDLVSKVYFLFLQEI